MKAVETIHMQWLDESDKFRKQQLEDQLLAVLFDYYTEGKSGYQYLFDTHYLNHVSRVIDQTGLKLRRSLSPNKEGLVTFKLIGDEYREIYVDFFSEETYKFLERYTLEEHEQVSVVLNHIINQLSFKLDRMNLNKIEYIRRSSHGH